MIKLNDCIDPREDEFYADLYEHIRGSMQRYIQHGIPPGSFLSAVIRNELFGAFSRADDENTHRMHDLVIWMYNKCPVACRGEENMDKWIEKGGLFGKDKDD